MSSSVKPYVQFSKRIVVLVTICVTVISLIGIVMAYFIGQMQYGAQIIKIYIGYAMVVFASYSGNSVAEKIIKTKYGSQDSTDQATNSNG